MAWSRPGSVDGNHPRNRSRASYESFWCVGYRTKCSASGRTPFGQVRTRRRAAQSQTEARTRARAKAKITVQNSEAKPYDQTASPALVEVRLTETFTGDIEGESPVRAFQVLREDKSACLVSMQRFRGRAGRRHGTLCFKAQKSSRMERSRRRGLSFLDQAQAVFPDCVARAALKANLGEGPTERWIIGSNDAATISCWPTCARSKCLSIRL